MLVVRWYVDVYFDSVYSFTDGPYATQADAIADASNHQFQLGVSTVVRSETIVTFDRMLHSPAQVVRYALVDLGLGVLPPALPWPVYATNEPSDPDDCITVYDTAGRKQGRTMVDGEVQESYGVQVRVRSVDQPTGYVEVQNIAVSMDSKIDEMSITVTDPPGTATYIVFNISRTGPVLFIGTDGSASKRTLHTLNALCTIKRVA